jgi:hypothetical protein
MMFFYVKESSAHFGQTRGVKIIKITIIIPGSAGVCICHFCFFPGFPVSPHLARQRQT